MKNKRSIYLQIEDTQLRILIRETDGTCAADVRRFETPVTAQHLIRTLEGLSQKQETDLTLVLPRSLFMSRYIRIPAETDEEVEAMLSYQLARVLPCLLEEVLYDHRVVDRKDGYALVLVLLVQEKKIEPILDFLRAARMIPSGLTVTSSGCAGWLTLQDIRRSGPAIVIDVDSDRAEFVAAADGQVLFSRMFSWSDEDRLLQGVRQCEVLFEKEFSQTAGYLPTVITGIAAGETLARRLTAGRDVRYQRVTGIEQVSCSFCAPVGLAAISAGAAFEFSPQAVRVNKRRQQMKKDYVSYAIIALEVVMLLSLWIFKLSWDRRQYADYLRHKVAAYRQEAGELEAMESRIRLIGTLARQRQSFTQLLKQVFSSLDNGAFVSSLELRENGEVMLKGYARVIGDVFAVADRIGNGGMFKDIVVQHAAQVRSGDGQMTEFMITARRAVVTDMSIYLREH
jgi:hypothetical protein